MRKLSATVVAIFLNMAIFCSLEHVCMAMLPEEQKLPDDITVLAIDCKMNKQNQLKTCELTNGLAGGFEAYDEVFEMGGVWRRVWEYCTRFDKKIATIGFRRGEKTAFESLKSLGGSFFRPHELQRTNRDNLQSSIVFRCGNPLDFVRLMGLDEHDDHDILCVNRYVYPYTAKLPTSQLFDLYELSAFRPYAKIYPRKYRSNLAFDVQKDFSSRYVIIKPSLLSNSKGVIVTSTEHLDEIFKIILRPYILKRNDSKRPSIYNDWRRVKESHFIVEEFVESDSLEVNGRLYDPTMRIVIMMSCFNNEITIDYLVGFKKIPKYALDDDALITDKHVSKYRDDFAQLSSHDLSLSFQEQEEVMGQLREIFTVLYPAMLHNIKVDFLKH